LDKAFRKQPVAHMKQKRPIVFFGNERVTQAVLIEELRQKILERIAPGGVVLRVQDTTSADFSGRAGTAGLGMLENQHSRGLFAHTTLAVSGNGQPANGKLFRTTGGNSGGSATYNQLTTTGFTIYGTITSIWVDPTDSNLVYATTTYASTPEFTAVYVFKSADGGATWTNITGNLPDNGVQTIVAYQSNAGRVH
jgi:hypothetical protein